MKITSKEELKNYLMWADTIFENWTENMINELEDSDSELIDEMADVVIDNNQFVERIKNAFLENYGK